jgi:hypothetical protein
MSLYGTGRGEGIAAALIIAAMVVGVRALGAWLVDSPDLTAAAIDAALPAVGGITCYRFLRAQGRSRYAAFLAGAAYALSPWLAAIGGMPREQLAAALAPLALEAACRCDRPSWRRVWLPRATFCMPLPFVAGSSLIAIATGVLCAAALVRTIVCGDREVGRQQTRPLVIVVVVAILAAANLVWLDPLAPWFADAVTMTPLEVLTAHRPSYPGFDFAAVLRVPGPVILTFVVLGLLRRQRHVDTVPWCALALAGALPTAFVAIPGLAAVAPSLTLMPAMPATAWWLTLLACVVLGAAGLDDFLDLPLRRRTALPWLLAIAVAGAPLLPSFTHVPTREWPLTMTFLGLALMLPAWRQLGILRFKNWLAAMALIALAIPLLQVMAPPAMPMPMPLAMPAAPAGDVRPPDLLAAPGVPTPPWWHYSGLLLAAFVGGCLWLSAWRRKWNARAMPSAAKAAIVKKAKPSKRS